MLQLKTLSKTTSQFSINKTSKSTKQYLYQNQKKTIQSKKNYYTKLNLSDPKSKDIFEQVGIVPSDRVEQVSEFVKSAGVQVTPEQVGVEWAEKILSGDLVREGWTNYLSVEIMESGTYAWYQYLLFPFQYLLEAIHTHTGLPWWGCIVAVSVIMRVILIPIFVKQQQTTSKLADLSPKLEALQEQTKRQPHLAKEMPMQMQKIYREAGVSPLTAFKFALVQVPLFVLFFCIDKKNVRDVAGVRHWRIWFFYRLNCCRSIDEVTYYICGSINIINRDSTIC